MALLLLTFLAVNCISIAAIEHSSGIQHTHLIDAFAGILLVACSVPLFLLCGFNFGYLVGVGFYGLIAGFVWISYFSVLDYDHARARLSAIASLFAFLLPVLFQTAPLHKPIALSPSGMDRLLVLAMCSALALLFWNGSYGFAIVGIRDAEELRSTFLRPSLLNYVTGSWTGAVLPFAFGYFALRGRYVLAGLSIVLISAFYPVLLTKTVLFAAAWLPFLFLVFQTFEPKRAAVLVLLVPLVGALLLYAVAPQQGPLAVLASQLFGYVNIRMMAIPSIAMDYYSEFFSQNPLTGFCQINIVRAIAGCPYAKQLGPLLAERYGLGNFNASLFSTEGIASVGPLWAPISAFVCGLIVSIGNNVSARLHPTLTAVSAGLVLQALLNVPLSITLLSNGFLTLLLLWYVAPAELKQNHPAPSPKPPTEADSV